MAAYSQSDRGTITGTISDPAGAVIAGAPIEAKNLETGAVYNGASSATGNYTLAQIPTGNYEVSVTVPGFKKYTRSGIAVLTAQTLRIDVPLEVGSTSDAVTVTEQASLLKTESGDLSHNVTADTLDNVPVLSIGAAAGTAGLRNPYSVLQMIPGASFTADSSIRVNGAPSNTMTLRVEGQDATNGWSATQSITQPSVDAIQEMAVQTSNYAAEYGQVGGGLFNVTMKSGTNRFHGTGYEYFVNEALNAGVPFTNNGKGGLLRPRARRNDYGFTLGGPVIIPKVYNGHDRLFFFFGFEQFRETIITNSTSYTLPTPAYRNGDFSAALTGRNLCAAATPNCSPLAGPIMENTIYDPATEYVQNGLVERNPFPGNMIPVTRFDPVAVAIQKMIPLPAGPNANGLINNFLPTVANPRLSYIPSVKSDYQISPSIKLSGYWSRTETNTPNNGALPEPITGTVPSYVVAHTVRLNYDQTLKPTLLLHLGSGLIYTYVDQPNPAFNPVTQLGLTGTYTNLFPDIGGLSGNQGGMSLGMGPGNAIALHNPVPTDNASLTWVKGNHTYKAGAEVRFEGYIAYNQTYTNGWMTFSPNQTGLPSLNGANLNGGNVGYGYASFLLGAVNNGFTGVPTTTRVGSHSFAWFVQDSWKVTRKITLDYGLRYDFSTYLTSEHGLMQDFGPSTPNPSAGGRLGAVVFDGYEPGRCQCHIASNYPFAYGPRVGLAYQILPTLVLRAGAGVSYAKTDDNNQLSFSTGSQNQYATSSFGEPAFLMKNGMPYQITWPNFNPGQLPLPGTTTGPLIAYDRHAGRPARQTQWSIGLQKELKRNFVVEAAYVGNRGAWWSASAMVQPNQNTPSALLADGLNVNSATDRAVLTSTIGSTTAIQRGFGGLPYSGFPIGSTVAQSLRPYPQFGTLIFNYPPDGDTWYNSLQVKATKRFSHGLDFSSSFTWAKQEYIGSEEDFVAGQVNPVQNDVFNRPQNKYLSGFDQPFLFTFAGGYTTPKLAINKAASWIARDWTLSAVLRYGSGLPIEVPLANNALNSILYTGGYAAAATNGTLSDRVAGQPLFLDNLNCHCFDPTKTFVLNPKAWVDPPAGQFGTSAAYYSDYRQQRRPMENLAFGRVFRIKERSSLQIRAEFQNIFNRTEINAPTSTNAAATQLSSSTTGLTTSGFGYINTGTVAVQPRQGQLVARFTF